jgi:hypothetical protein
MAMPAQADAPLVCGDINHPTPAMYDYLGHPHCPGSPMPQAPMSTSRGSSRSEFNPGAGIDGALDFLAGQEAERQAAEAAASEAARQREAERQAMEVQRRQAMAAADAQRRAAECNPFNGCAATAANDNPFTQPDSQTCSELLRIYRQSLANIPQSQPWQEQADLQLQQAGNAKWGYQADGCGTLPALPARAPRSQLR